MTYLVKFLQNNPNRMVKGDRMYDANMYGGVIPLYCQEIPEEIKWIIEWSETSTINNKDKISWYLDEIIEIDRRCKLIIEVFDDKDLMHRMYF